MLEGLACENNQLSELDVSQNKELYDLWCSNNQLSELDVSNNEVLIHLDCSNNQLSELDVSNNEVLIYLDCSNNQLKELDISKNTALDFVCCTQCSMTSLYLNETQQKDYNFVDEEQSNHEYIFNLEYHKHKNTIICAPAPEIQAVNNGNESYRLEGIDETMEYNTVSADYTGKWTRYRTGALQDITEVKVYYVRIPATATKPASGVATVYVTPNAFTITVICGGTGNITPNGTIIVRRGESKTFEITPNKGYKIENVYIDGEGIGPVDSYTFKNITKNHKIRVTFKKKSVTVSGGNGGSSSGITLSQGIITSKWRNKFTDVSKDDWFYDVVKFVNERKYFSGMTETEFGPNETMTREMFMMALYNMDGNPITYGPNNYYDVAPGHWSEAAIVWGSAKGLISGFPDGSFKPGEPVTREQVATIMKKYAEYKFAYTENREDLTRFNDYSEVSDWAYNSISWAVARGVMKGDTANFVMPKKSATRAEVAAMFMNYKKTE